MCVYVVSFKDVEEAVDICLDCCVFDFFLFFWLMSILSRFVSMVVSLIF